MRTKAEDAQQEPATEEAVADLEVVEAEDVKAGGKRPQSQIKTEQAQIEANRQL
jgi:hypothetical protein